MAAESAAELAMRAKALAIGVLRPERRLLLVGAFLLAAILLTTGTTVLILVRGSGHISPPAVATATTTQPSCASSGCALVSVSRTAPRAIVFYGASCAGVRGYWFFNAVEGGSADQLRPSYSLHWAFTPGASNARPGGTILIVGTKTTQVSLSLNQGVLTLVGQRAPSVKVRATGTLVVTLSGSAAQSALTFTESGLQKAESALGLVSPFDLNGQPLTVPIKTVKTLAGC